jgi:hypothetical protein
MAKRASVPEGKAVFYKPPESIVRQPVGETLGVVPSEEKVPIRQSAVFLAETHIDWLEDRCREARRKGGRAIRKATIIRALLDVAMEAPIDLTGLRREEDVVDRIRKALRG